MTQATILAEGTGSATSSDVAVAAGAIATVGLFVSSGTVQPGSRAIVFVDTPGTDNKETELDHIKKEVQVNGPATYRVKRVEGSFGIFSET